MVSALELAKQINFQFSLWDSLSTPKSLINSRPAFNSLYEIQSKCFSILCLIICSFNSLYEIPRNPVWIRYKLKNFQFSLWDSYFLLLFFSPLVFTFNSLYEIQGIIKIPLSPKTRLSILFMRFLYFKAVLLHLHRRLSILFMRF